MVSYVSNSTNAYQCFFTFNSYLELQAIMIIYTDRVIAIVEGFEIQRIKDKQILHTRCTNQRIYSLLILLYHLLLESELFALTLPRHIEFLQIVFLMPDMRRA